MKKILLGSNSPRRRDLLKRMGYDFDIVKIDCDEKFDKAMNTNEVAESLAKLKSQVYGVLDEGELLITADTTVLTTDKILNKPKNRDEAIEMLMSLSGKTHRVVTGVCIRETTDVLSFSEETTVQVAELSLMEVFEYVEKFNPFDKAGAYGIQEWFGLRYVTKLIGCYFNVVGLPTSTLHTHLKRILNE